MGQIETKAETYQFSDLELERLVVCPKCDALFWWTDPGPGARARCARCHTTLFTPRTDAFGRMVLLSLTVLILMVGALFFPFLRIQVGGLTHNTSVMDAVLAFSDGLMLPLSAGVAALIVLIPLTRAASVIYTVLPLWRGHAPYAHAANAFRLAEALRPWAMAEIFILGVAVALVKVAGLAQLTLGPAFWAFSALVIVTVLNDNLMCRWTVWNSLERRAT